MRINAGPTLVWFRHDLRLSDNPALAAAADRGSPVIPVFIWAPEEEGSWQPGAASRWWLHHSLGTLSTELQERGSRLIVRHGPTGKTLHDLLRETGASAVFWNRRYEPSILARDWELQCEMRERGVTAESFNGSLLFEPSAIRSSSGQPFQVFTAFWRACLDKPIAPASKDAPGRFFSPESWPESRQIADLALQPSADWAGGLREAWQPGESGAILRLKRFQEEGAPEYSVGRDRPGIVGTSRLSPHLRFGEISPGQIWRAAAANGGKEAYLRQLVWREFAYQLLHHHPELPEQALRPEFAAFPWKTDPPMFRAWTQGKTGYPLVDAGMRELWHTGWMHNRVRMVTASFLVKHLLIGWQEGAAWFWDTLVDADLANNTLGWQWVAGCGADAAPYFRIFNPVIQGEKFDSTGRYVRRWVPELAELPDPWIHKPWTAPASILAKAGVELGKAYPFPIVDHEFARKRALAALQIAKTKRN